MRITKHGICKWRNRWVCFFVCLLVFLFVCLFVCFVSKVSYAKSPITSLGRLAENRVGIQLLQPHGFSWLRRSTSVCKPLYLKLVYNSLSLYNVQTCIAEINLSILLSWTVTETFTLGLTQALSLLLRSPMILLSIFRQSLIQILHLVVVVNKINSMNNLNQAGAFVICLSFESTRAHSSPESLTITSTKL